MAGRRCWQLWAVLVVTALLVVATYHSSAEGATILQNNVRFFNELQGIQRKYDFDASMQTSNEESNTDEEVIRRRNGRSLRVVKRLERSTSKTRMDQNRPASQVVVNGQQEACILQCTWDCHNFSCSRKCVCKNP